MISFLQKERIKKEVQMEYLENGQSPSEKDLVRKIAVSRQKHIPGMPYFQGFEVVPHGISNSSKWNDSFRFLEKDLDVLFEANGSLNSQMISLEERSDLENRYYHSKVNLLSIKLKGLQDSLKEKISSRHFAENFMNFKNIDLSGNSEVNLLEHSVSLEKSRGSKRQDAGQATLEITPLSSYESQEESGEAGHILSDFQNQNKILKYVTDSGGTFSLKLSSSFKNTLRGNSVVVRMENVSPIEASLYVSEDDVRYEKIYSVTGDRYFEWQFKEQDIKSFYIIFQKSTADGYEDGKYQHQFIFRNVSVYKNIYEGKGVLLSKEIPLKEVVDQVTIHPEEFLPQGTNIKYSIGLMRNDGAVRWIGAEKNIPISFNLLEEKEEVINSLDAGYAEMESEKVYRIYRLLENASESTVHLHCGYQMWYAEKLKNIGGFDYSPTLSSYDASKITEKRVIDTEQHTFSLVSRDMEVLTQYVYVKEDSIVEFSEALATENKEKFHDVLYLNGMKIEKDRGMFAIPLKKGINKIIYLLYLESGANQEEYGTIITTKINFREITDDIYGFPEMKYINPYALKNPSLGENYRYYSIENGNVLVKHNPLKQKNLSGEEMRYYISYKYLTKDSPYIFQGKKNLYTKIKIKALLASDSTDFSPKITSYQLSSE